MTPSVTRSATACSSPSRSRFRGTVRWWDATVGTSSSPLLPGAGRPEAERYRNDVIEALDQIGLQDPQTGAGVPVFVSSGIAICPIEANRIEELIQLADSGMYAEKRLRRESSSGLLDARHRGGDIDAARIVGEIVPYLTTTGNLEEKLRLVARRLSVAAGYDAVSFMLFDADPDAPPSLVTFARGPEKLLNKMEHRRGETHEDRTEGEVRARASTSPDHARQ